MEVLEVVCLKKTDRRISAIEDRKLFQSVFVHRKIVLLKGIPEDVFSLALTLTLSTELSEVPSGWGNISV